MPTSQRNPSPRLLRLAREAEPDAELLGRFIRSRDESAFAILVERHGPMVHGVCRRALGDVHAADDAFQATFFALARNAKRVREPRALAAWLYGAAVRVARSARRSARRAEIRKRTTPPRPVADPLAEITGRELLAAIDDELARLPEPFRAAVVLCCLEGLSQEEAARRLGWSSGSVKGRLERGRERLRRRLAHRGITLSCALALLAASRTTSDAHDLFRTTARIAVTGSAPSTVAHLANAAVGTGPLPKLAAVALLVLSAGAMTPMGVGDPPQPQQPKRLAVPEPVAVMPRLVDRFGDPLPEGAVARLGSTRWRHEGEAQAMSFSPDGKSLAVISTNDGSISFFATATGALVHRLTRATDRYRQAIALAYSPDGSLLVTQDTAPNLQLWDTKTKKLVRELKMPGAMGSPGQYMKFCFSPDGKLLAANNGEAAIIVWDASRGAPVSTITGHNHSNPSLVFTPDNSTLLVAAGNPTVHLYDARTGKRVRGIDTDAKFALSLALSADGKVVASGSRDRIVLSDFESGKELGRLEAPMGAALDMAFTPDGKTLVSGSEDGKVRVWDVAARKERFVLDGRGWIGRSMALSKDGKTVALGTVYNVVRLWDVDTGKEQFDPADGHDAPVHAVAFSPDGRLLVTGGENQQIRLWDAATGNAVRQFRGSSAGQVSFSPDGRRLVSAWAFNPNVRVWDVERGETVRTLAHEGDVRVPTAAFAADGRNVLTVSWRRSNDTAAILKAWDAESGKPQSALELPGLRWPCALAVSANGRWAAVGGQSDRPVRLVDLNRRRERRALVDEHAGAKSAAFSPDGRVLAVGAVDGATRLLEMETGAGILRLSGHERSVASMAFAPDGRVLATAEGGPESVHGKEKPGPQTIRFWDLATGRELARLAGHESSVNALAYTPDGRRLVSGLNNGAVLIWEVPAASRPAMPKPVATELAVLWKELAGADVRRAYDAVWSLAGSDAGVAFLAASLRPARKADAATVQRWIADLDSGKFPAREAASRQLAALGEDAEAALRAVLERPNSAEVHQRIQTLLDALLDSPPPERLRELRAVWALEISGTPAARKVLSVLATGDSDARLTREAAAAETRLAR